MPERSLVFSVSLPLKIQTNKPFILLLLQSQDLYSLLRLRFVTHF